MVRVPSDLLTNPLVARSQPVDQAQSICLFCKQLAIVMNVQMPVLSGMDGHQVQLL